MGRLGFFPFSHYNATYPVYHPITPAYLVFFHLVFFTQFPQQLKDAFFSLLLFLGRDSPYFFLLGIPSAGFFSDWIIPRS